MADRINTGPSRHSCSSLRTPERGAGYSFKAWVAGSSPAALTKTFNGLRTVVFAIPRFPHKFPHKPDSNYLTGIRIWLPAKHILGIEVFAGTPTARVLSRSASVPERFSPTAGTYGEVFRCGTDNFSAHRTRHVSYTNRRSHLAPLRAVAAVWGHESMGDFMQNRLAYRILSTILPPGSIGAASPGGQGNAGRPMM
jgi:hypothetical protein